MTDSRGAAGEKPGLLETVYDALDYRTGGLMRPSEEPSSANDGSWQSLGEWLTLTSRVGADRVFFVEDDPVVVFTQVPPGTGEAEVVAAYRRAWSLGRARCLFLATEDELRVYALTAPPPRGPDDAAALTPVDVVNRSAEVLESLGAYHRERVESGLLFESEAFRRDGRADDSLLRDVDSATEALVRSGLPRGVAHALIERVILVRYMEDRNIVVPNYFERIAAQDDTWLRDFSSLPEVPAYGARSTFVQCLNNPDLTRAVFAALASDFNGDLFTISSAEMNLVAAEHLRLIQRLLTGEGWSGQQPLFLWAYDFSVVPTALISSMYERFYRADTDDQSSTHYTPQELVEFVTAQVLTETLLAGNPTICDPACGSGIFLVEAYRRIVRHDMARLGRRLNTGELRYLLLDRINGIDINAEAVRLAAFSLYLAFLSYQSPPDIRRAGPLPKLIATEPDMTVRVLRVTDAFAVAPDASTGSHSTTASPPAGGTTDQPTTSGYDVIIGNPPWDEPRGGPATLADRWAQENKVAVGDRNQSQLFLWRSLSLLKPGGVAALLVAATAFHNTRPTSRQFRIQFLRNVRLVSVVNFSSTRRTFFGGAAAPFMLVTFRPSASEEAGAVSFRTVRPSAPLGASKSMAFASIDRRWVDQRSLEHRDYLWKVYAWGSHRDAAFMTRLELEDTIADLLPLEPKPGWGYQRGSGEPSKYLASLPPLKSFEPWGPLSPDSFEEPPTRVKRQPDERLYSGQRILVRRGIRVGFGPRSRLVTDPMSFRHTIFCLPLQHLTDWQAKVVWATLLSSLGRYSMFMRSGSWGLWHDSVLASDILATPVRLPQKPNRLTAKLVSAVDSLRDGNRAVGSYAENLREGSADEIPLVLESIDQAIYELFQLSDDEVHLITDFHNYLLGFAGGQADRFGSRRVRPPSAHAGTARDVSQIESEPLQSYVTRFLESWNRRLAPDGALAWRIATAPRRDLLAIVFETYSGDDPVTLGSETAWDDVLSRLPPGLDTRRMDYVNSESVMRIVTDTSIVIVKRDTPRFWSASAAAEDAEATLLQAMKLNA